MPHGNVISTRRSWPTVAAVLVLSVVLSVVLSPVSGLGPRSTTTGAVAERVSSGNSSPAAEGHSDGFDIAFPPWHTEPTISTASVTPDGARYAYSYPGSGTVVVAAPAASGVNEREFFWDEAGPDESDSTVCGTFSTGEGIDQQGIVLRLNDVNGDITALTVTRNVMFFDFQSFNFHVWNTSDTGHPFTLFAQTSLPVLPYAPAVYPLSMCARTVTNTNQVQFVVWTKGQIEPQWGDPMEGGEATIPVGFPARGREGFFAGHVVPGTSMFLTDLRIDGEPL